MKRAQCNGRNPRGTGPCQATAQAGHADCARCGGRRKPRAAKASADGANYTGRWPDLHEPDSALPEAMTNGPQPWWCRSFDEDARHHVQAAADFAANSERWRTEQSDDDDGHEYTRGRIRGHLVRAAVALLSWLMERESVVVQFVAPTDAPASPQAAEPRVYRCAYGDCDAPALEDEMRCAEHVGQPTPMDAAFGACPEEEDAPRAEAVDAARLVLDERGVRLYQADWRALLDVARDAGGVDALIVDAPYSERTHAGHDGGAAQANGADCLWPRANGMVEAKRQRRDLDYGAWTADDVAAFVDAWHPLVRGWIVSLTDDGLFPHWRAAMDRVGRQTFQDVPCVVRGMSVRLVGDGPSSWAVHAAVGRPRTKAMAQWGTLDGAYEGPYERQSVVGGKPAWLMRALVRDYTRPGDLVCDPCVGAGTLGVACIAEGRRALLGDRDPAHVALAAERLRALPAEPKRGTLPLFGRSA